MFSSRLGICFSLFRKHYPHDPSYAQQSGLVMHATSYLKVNTRSCLNPHTYDVVIWGLLHTWWFLLKTLLGRRVLSRLYLGSNSISNGFHGSNVPDLGSWGRTFHRGYFYFLDEFFFHFNEGFIRRHICNGRNGCFTFTSTVRVVLEDAPWSGWLGFHQLGLM